MRVVIISIIFILHFFPVQSQKKSVSRYADSISNTIYPDFVIPYKTVDSKELRLHVLMPPNAKPGLKPCFIGFHGGGWTWGSPVMLYSIVREICLKTGMIGILPEYRLIKKGDDQTTLADCVDDMQSAMQFIADYANKLNIDKNNVILSGASAGGLLALGSVLFDHLDAGADKTNQPIHPKALVLYYPVVNTSIRGYGYEKIGEEKWRKFSPYHHIHKKMPPVLIFHGKKDEVVPFKNIVDFKRRMRLYKNSCQLIVDENGGHGYFLYNQKEFDQVIDQTVHFIQSKMPLVDKTL